MRKWGWKLERVGEGMQIRLPAVPLASVMADEPHSAPHWFPLLGHPPLGASTVLWTGLGCVPEGSCAESLGSSYEVVEPLGCGWSR